MSTSPTASQTQRGRFLLCLSGIMIVTAAGGLFLWQASRPVENHISPTEHVPLPPQIDLINPPESFLTLRHVQETGGCDTTRPVAISWLDRHAREHTALRPEQIDYVFTMIEQGGHTSWPSSYRQHLYNSAFNALHHCRVEERYTRVMHYLALHDADRTMRLYALQHLGAQRRIGVLDGTLADEIKATLVSLASDAQGDLSGTAIQVLSWWDGSLETIEDPTTLALALATAEDSSRPVDIRVSAIHAAGPASLPLARRLASDTVQPLMVRKSAIARIGHHGDARDLSALETLRSESSRLAQAAEPALQFIRDRQAHPNRPAPRPL